MSGGGGSDNEFEVQLNLTALLDVLTNLLFFLMIGLSAHAANFEVPSNLTLPNSEASSEPKKDIVLRIAQGKVFVNKQPVVSLSSSHQENVNRRIDLLYQYLAGLRRKQHTDVVAVMCDKQTHYGVLYRVLNTAAMAGYPKFRMLALIKE